METPNRVLLYKEPTQLITYEVLITWTGSIDCYGGHDCAKVMSLGYGSDDVEYDRVVALGPGLWLWEGERYLDENDEARLRGEYRRLTLIELANIAAGFDPPNFT